MHHDTWKGIILQKQGLLTPQSVPANLPKSQRVADSVSALCTYWFS